jgi:hypothetical protein
MAAPSFISSTAVSSWTTTTSPKTTASIAVQNGDVLVAHGILSNDGIGISLSISTATGSTSAWTLKQESSQIGGAAHIYIRTWWATATATGNITVTCTRSGGTDPYGVVVKVWRGSGGIGNSNAADNGTSSGSPSVSVTTTGANSALSFATADWNATAGTVTFTASTGSPVTDVSDQTGSGTLYCIYSDHIVDASATGSKTMGMSAPSTQRYQAHIIEILGQASSFIAGRPLVFSQAVKRAATY